jgi:hypothetical protein
MEMSRHDVRDNPIFYHHRHLNFLVHTISWDPKIPTISILPYFPVLLIAL